MYKKNFKSQKYILKKVFDQSSPVQPILEYMGGSLSVTEDKRRRWRRQLGQTNEDTN